MTSENERGVGTPPPLLTMFFAQWRIPGGRWTNDHWIRDGKTACGRTVPASAVVRIPPTPTLSCARCIDAIRRRDGTPARSDEPIGGDRG